jgi:deoxyribodipyrimidine photo-lyase
MQNWKTFRPSHDLHPDHLLDEIDVVQYGRTRNFLQGSVTALSPYISRGIISTRMVMERVIGGGYNPYRHEKFLQQLAWRDYFQRVLQSKPDLDHVPIKQPQLSLRNDIHVIPTAIVHGSTGVVAIDQAIQQLYTDGWMHNHARMYVASLVTNIGGYSWQTGGRWMYYHLLDADIASNYCSWQWISGAFSSKRYLANQDNINKYSGSRQSGSFLDTSYETLELMDVPPVLLDNNSLDVKTSLPEGDGPLKELNYPVALYNMYNLDPKWHQGKDMHRVLLLEPSHFDAFPVSEKVLAWVMGQAALIPEIHVFVGEFSQFVKDHPRADIVYKEHPIFNYHGTMESRDWMFPEVTGYFPSFFGYWKRCQKYL